MYVDSCMCLGGTSETNVDTKRGKKRATLGVSTETKAMPDALRHSGQSYKGLIQELGAFWEKARGG